MKSFADYMMEDAGMKKKEEEPEKNQINKHDFVDHISSYGAKAIVGFDDFQSGSKRRDFSRISSSTPHMLKSRIDFPRLESNDNRLRPCHKVRFRTSQSESTFKKGERENSKSSLSFPFFRIRVKMDV